LPNDTALARALLFIGVVTIGALVGRRFDRGKRRKTSSSRARSTRWPNSPATS